MAFFKGEALFLSRIIFIIFSLITFLLINEIMINLYILILLIILSIFFVLIIFILLIEMPISNIFINFKRIAKFMYLKLSLIILIFFSMVEFRGSSKINWLLLKLPPAARELNISNYRKFYNTTVANLLTYNKSPILERVLATWLLLRITWTNFSYSLRINFKHLISFLIIIKIFLSMTLICLEFEFCTTLLFFIIFNIFNAVLKFLVLDVKLIFYSLFFKVMRFTTTQLRIKIKLKYLRSFSVN